ncbi:uncharacterized protein LOC122506945 [Leptopilina heterotoma]|uniref:uncharacterized protein LOC122506945 n=1 Tax=Leptopilina heterotoma TaxID=63436 RepID=UPI001CA98A9E|nr:uncharacterized protein LOC122506945 [Leptopilina heterotoma]
MEIFESGYFNINKKTLSFLGLWVRQKFWQKVLMQSVTFLVVISTIYVQTAFVIHIDWRNNLDDVLNCCGTIIIYVMALSMLSVYFFKQKKLMFFVDCIENDWKLWTSKQTELSILDKYAKIGRRYCFILFQYNFSGLSAYLLMNLSPLLLDVIVPLNESRAIEPIYPAKFFFDEDKYYKYVLLHGALTCAWGLAIFCTMDSMFVTTIQHACGLFAIIRYVKELEDFYSTFLLISNGSNILTISFPLLQTSLSVGNTVSVVKQSILSIATMAHAYFLGIPAQNLINESAAVAFDIYDSEWYELPIKIQKLVLFIIMHGHIPCQLTAGKIAVMNMETVAQILKLAFSYFTMLSAVSQSTRM